MIHVGCCWYHGRKAFLIYLFFFSTVISTGATSVNQASSGLTKMRERETDGCESVETTTKPETANALPLGVASKTGKSTDALNVTTVKNVESTGDRAVRVTILVLYWT